MKIILNALAVSSLTLVCSVNYKVTAIHMTSHDLDVTDDVGGCVRLWFNGLTALKWCVR